MGATQKSRSRDRLFISTRLCHSAWRNEPISGREGPQTLIEAALVASGLVLVDDALARHAVDDRRRRREQGLGPRFFACAVLAMYELLNSHDYGMPRTIPIFAPFVNARRRLAALAAAAATR